MGRLKALMPVACALLTGWGTTQALAGGYEQPLNWSARYSASGGGAVSSAKGPQALFFNPAALSALQGWELSLDGGATIYKNEAPLTTANLTVSSGTVGPQFGGFLGYSLTPRLGIAAGVYTAGQTRSSFEAVDLHGVNTEFDMLKPVVQSSLDFTEISFGAGYALTDNLSVGAAFRTLLFRGALSTLSYTPNQATAAEVDAIDIQNISATKSGVRLGARYTADDYHWGIGIEWRSKITLNASADADARSETSTSGSIPVDHGSSAVQVSTIFPQQLAIGGHVDAVPRVLRLTAEYDWTNYGVNKFIGVTGTANGVVIPSILQDWSNLQQVRLGAAWQAAELWQLRAGYVYSSQVVPEERASALFEAPSATNTFSAGVGTWISRVWSFDLSADYTTGSSTVNPVQSVAGTNVGAPSYAGTYTTSAIGVYAGFGRRF